MINKNFIVDNGKAKESDAIEYFADEDVITVSDKADMHDLLVLSGIYKSKSEAKKKWKATDRIIPKGFSMYRKVEGINMISILNP